MQTHEFEQFRTLLAGVHDFYARDLSEFSLSVWWESMRQYDLAAVTQAMNRHVMNPDNGQFMPKPADVRKMLGGTSADAALRAWAKVDKAVRQVGNYASVAFDDPLIHRVISEMGGWIGLGQKTEDEWPFVAKHFENLYRGYAMRGEQPDYPPVLVGIAQADSEARGLRFDPPRLVGDQEKAMAVIAGGDSRPAIGMSGAGAIAHAEALQLAQKEVA